MNFPLISINMSINDYNRRDFLKTSILGGVALTNSFTINTFFTDSGQESVDKPVSISTGTDRADMAFKALKPFSRQIKRSIGNRRVVLKPNNVLIYVPLACTHVETLEGILEFLKSINKLHNVIIAESSASGSTLEGFDNYGYYKLISKYPVKLVDLDDGPSENMYVIDEKDFKPHPVKVSSIITVAS